MCSQIGDHRVGELPNDTRLIGAHLVMVDAAGDVSLTFPFAKDLIPPDLIPPGKGGRDPSVKRGRESEHRIHSASEPTSGHAGVRACGCQGLRVRDASSMAA